MKPFITFIGLVVASTFSFAQKAADKNNDLTSYPPLPAGLLVEPPAHYLQWECDTSLEDQSLFFTEYTPTYTYHVLSYSTTGYDSAALVMISCHQYGISTTPTQELETALRLFESAEWDSIEYLVPIKGSLKQQHKWNSSLTENSPLIKATKGDRKVELTIYYYENEPNYQIFSTKQQSTIKKSSRLIQFY
jgi:hypothetical protein